jgi:hypothetical protein
VQTAQGNPDKEYADQHTNPKLPFFHSMVILSCARLPRTAPQTDKLSWFLISRL